MKVPQDDLYKKMASLYVRREGELLLEELDGMAEEETRITPRMDARVKAEIGGRKRHYRIAATVAACLVLMLLVPSLVNLSRQGPSSTAPMDAPDSANLMMDGDEAAEFGLQITPELEEAAPEPAEPMEPVVPQTDSGEEPPPEEAPPERANVPTGGSGEPVLEEENPVTGGGDPAPEELPPGMGDALVGGSGEGLIPLSFALPPNLSVASAEEDNGKSIYRLANTLQDDVVLTLEYEADPDFSGLEATEVDGATVYYKYRSDYSLVTFEKEGILYEMTCKHDVATLLDLSSYIL